MRFSDLLSELKQRRVFRVSAVYALVAWGVMEVSDVVFPALGLPPWTVTLVVALAILGFPLAVVLAWAFQVTPEGVERAPPPLSSGRGASPRPEGPAFFQRRSVWFVAGMLVFGTAAWIFFSRGEPEPTAELDARLVAVFPFRVSGADPSLGYLREGMMDLLTAKLNGDVGPRALDPRLVLGRVPEAEDVAPERASAVAGSLGAGRLLVGSVVGSQDRLTVSASMIDVAGGTEEVATASGPADSLSALADRLVASLLSLEAGEDEERLASLTSTSLAALRHYLDGRSEYRRGRYREAAHAFNRALQIDSTFALAGLALSEAVNMGTGTGFPSGSRGLELAWAARERLGRADREYLAIRRGPGVPRSTVEALRSWERATRLLPDRPEVWYEYGDLLFHEAALVGAANHVERAAAAFDRAVALDSALYVALQHRLWTALSEGDTAAVRRLLPRLRALSKGGWSAFTLEWTEASLSGDTARLSTLRAALDTAGRDVLITVHHQPYWGIFEELGPEDAGRALDRLEATASTGEERWHASFYRHAFTLNLGRPRRAVTLSEGWGEEQPDPTYRLRRRIRDGLYWDGDSRAAARAAGVLARRLERGEIPPGARPEEHYSGLCDLGQWRLWTGEAGAASSTVAAVEALRAAASDSTLLGVHNRICARLLETLAARGGDRAALEAEVRRLDALLRTGPPGDDLRHRANLSLVRLFRELDDPASALAAARRQETSWGAKLYHTTFLRERARLASAIGDREAAIRAYRRYLDFRIEPEPALRAEVDAMRRELEELLGGAG